MKILLIEDLHSAATSILTALHAGNCDVAWVVGVQSVEVGTHSDIFEVQHSDGSESEVLLKEFALAFVDFELDGAFDGAELIPHLRKSGVVCVGISAKADLNGELAVAGAHMCIPKHALVDEICLGQLDLSEIVDTYQTEVGPDEDVRALLRKYGYR